MMSNSVWGLFANFDPYYDPMFMCLVLLASMTAVICLRGPMTPRRRGWTFFVLAIGVSGVGFSTIIAAGLPMRGLRLADIVLVGAANDFATDTARPDLFSGAAQRVVPFQMLYPAAASGTYAPYMPEAGPQIDAMVENHGWTLGILLGRIGALAAPWTTMAQPASGGPMPVIIYLPGVTGYLQMGSFQTAALAANGYIVVTLNQPDAVAAALLPDGQIVKGLTREDAVLLIAPPHQMTARCGLQQRAQNGQQRTFFRPGRARQGRQRAMLVL